MLQKKMKDHTLLCDEVYESDTSMMCCICDSESGDYNDRWNCR